MSHTPAGTPSKRGKKARGGGGGGRNTLEYDSENNGPGNMTRATRVCLRKQGFFLILPIESLDDLLFNLGFRGYFSFQKIQFRSTWLKRSLLYT